MTAETTRQSSRDESELAKRTRAHQLNTLIIDGLGGSLVPEPPVVDGKSYLERLAGSGVKATNVTLAGGLSEFEELLEVIHHYQDLLGALPDVVHHVQTVSDLEECRSNGKVGVIFGTQSGRIVGNEMWRWSILHKLGVRVSQITYGERNYYGDGCMEPENRGLTSLGRQAVREMNRLGIVVDLSHVGERTALDATEWSRKPVIYSHSNAKALTPSKRNLTDEQMKAMADGGGVMGICPYSMMCYRTLGERPSLDDYFRHMDYAIERVGVDHVGIGSDLFEAKTKVEWEASTKRNEGYPYMFETKDADGYAHVADLPNVIRGMVARGYSDQDIAKIIGGNFLRVFKDVWQG